MCLLTFLPPGVPPDLGALANGTEVNNDGHGWAIVADDTLLTGRGLDADAAIDAFAHARQRLPGGPAVFHSRLATHGTGGLDNCHPFPVGGDERTVIAHNGVLPAIVRPRRNDPRSDTRIAADEFLPALGPLRLRRTRQQLERWMGPDNKMVILTVDRRFTRRAHLLNEHAGIWHHGIWYSNDSYLPPRAPLGWQCPVDAPWTLDDELAHPTTCRSCARITPDLGYCHGCGACLDCRDDPDDCLCYQPASLDRSAR